MKFLKKKGTASHSGERKMVFGTAFSKFQTKVSKSNDLSKDCKDVVGLGSASSCCEWIESDRFCDFDFTLLEASPCWSALSAGHASNVEDGDLIELAGFLSCTNHTAANNRH